MPKIDTFITSKTWDYKNKCMYPDKDIVERELEDVERLLVEGHTIEWRSNNLVMTLNMDKFNTIVKPLFPDFDSRPEKYELPIEDNNSTQGRPLPPEGIYVAEGADANLLPKDAKIEIKDIIPTEDPNAVEVVLAKEFKPEDKKESEDKKDSKEKEDKKEEKEVKPNIKPEAKPEVKEDKKK